jgi:protein-S-isoprenylcysteine O-methyltransferase Ste14
VAIQAEADRCLVGKELERTADTFSCEISQRMKVLIAAVLFVYGVERVFETFRVRNKIEGAVVAGYTLYLLVGCHTAVFLVTVWDCVYWDELNKSVWYFWVGLLLIILAHVGRNWAIRALGRYHSIQIEIRSTHPLITSGPYRYSRNPYYLSNAIEIVGLPLIANSKAGVALALVLYWPTLWLRIVLEENALQKVLGERFCEYKLKTPRLIPRFGN